MTRHLVQIKGTDGGVLREGIEQIRSELGVTDEFPQAVEEAAREAVKNPRLPDVDRTDIPFVTIDPESSMDLDQALHIERDGAGFIVHYAIADVAAFVDPGGAIDVEANQRGQTLYGADSKIPLHPTVMSEDGASLLACRVRPALLWTINIDESGEGTGVHVERALVKSRAKLNYISLQKEIDAGTAPAMFGLLEEVGTLRKQRETARGGISLPLPEQEIVINGDNWSLAFRRSLPVEEWNAQISLLTGMAAAHLMVTHHVGLLRTLPEPEQQAVDRLRHTAKALKIDWAGDRTYAEMIRGLNPEEPHHAAMVVASTALLRGSGYKSFNGQVPDRCEHSAIASTYAHVTAPLRRLVDRYAGEICVAICAGQPVPEWVTAQLDELPETMQRTGRVEGRYSSAVVNLVEAGVLAPQVGQNFDAVVVDADRDDGCKGDIVIKVPAIEAHVTAEEALPVGSEVRVTLVEADVETRTVRFALTTISGRRP